MSKPPYPGAPRPKHIQIDLTPDAVEGLRTLRRIYGGASPSYCLNRLLRAQRFNMVPMFILIDSNVVGWLRDYAKRNGYEHIEELVADTLENAMKTAKGAKP